MNWVIYVFGSGDAFFWGIGLVLAGLLLHVLCRGKWSPPLATLIALLGLVLVGLSATPLSYWCYALAGLISLSWLVSERLAGPKPGIRTKSLRALLVLLWGAALVMEIPHQFAPRLEASGNPRLYIFADSVTAGMGEKSVKIWPKLLEERHSIPVTDFSQMGAKVKTMLKTAENVPLDDGIVLLEIGGNDLLGSTSAADFETHLDALLHLLCGPGRVVLMFELPLPPFRNDFGLAQRRLASKHGVLLIPKRIFICVLTADQATVDSIHLSRQGHERMAETIWTLIGDGYAK